MSVELPANLRKAIAQYWGFESLRPLQCEAMRAVMDGRDSLVVMPTGGGKSLCYQAPALVRDGLTVVVSPLIALMKDQVDSLARNGINAVRLDSTLSTGEWSDALAAIRTGTTKLVFISPERLVNSGTHELLREAGARTIAIDEAHCISHWGHDFRPEYRMLARLREFFPKASVHAYTATATEQVREDIVSQLNLDQPVVHVGNFDRPNLTYRVVPQSNVIEQIQEVLDRRKGEAGIVYCLRRKDVDDVCQSLRKLKYKAVPYHAGMTAEERKKSHDLFAAEEADIVVATIAFGMGIDRSNVRFVIHACVPKSIEHYQQETGRAGRDGLPSECLLLFSFADVMVLRKIMEKSALEANSPPEFLSATRYALDQMTHYASGAVCRHRALVRHFGQDYDSPNCGACDLCLGDTQAVPDSMIVAQKILSCVARVQESYGVNHVIDVLRGANTEAIRSRGHEQLSTYGLLKSIEKTDLRNYVFQLIGQNVLEQSEGDYPFLKLNAASWGVMKNKHPVRLIQMRTGESKAKAKEKTTLPTGADAELFDLLRRHRREQANLLKVPPYVIFADSVLAEMARCRPTTAVRMRMVPGVGDVKLRDFGDLFQIVIRDFCVGRGLETDLPPVHEKVVSTISPKKMSASKESAFRLFHDGVSIDEVVRQTALAKSTVNDYLADFIRMEKPKSIEAWVESALLKRVVNVVEELGATRLKPVFLALDEQVGYDVIRLVFAFLESRLE